MKFKIDNDAWGKVVVNRLNQLQEKKETDYRNECAEMILKKMHDVSEHDFRKTGESPLDDMEALCKGAITIKELFAFKL